MLYTPQSDKAILIFDERFLTLHHYAANYWRGLLRISSEGSDGLASLSGSYLTVVLLRKIFEEGEAHTDYNEICSDAKNQAIFLADAALDVRSVIDMRGINDIPTLWNVIDRALSLDDWFSTRECATKSIDFMGGDTFVNACVDLLKTDVDWQMIAIKTLINSVVTIEINKRAAINAIYEFAEQITSNPLIYNSFSLSLEGENTDEVRLWQTEAYDWLKKHCSLKQDSEAFRQDASNSLHDWIEEQLKMPFHERLKHLNDAPIATKRGRLDEWRRMTKHMPIDSENFNPLEDAPPIEDETLPVNDNKLREIRAVLGKTAFKVFEVQRSCTSLTAQQIAERLAVNEKTIDRSRTKIRKHYSVIEKIIWD